MSKANPWTVGEDMDNAKGLLVKRNADGQRYGRWLNARVGGLINEIERLRMLQDVQNCYRQDVVAIVKALPPEPEVLWRALGYDPDGFPCFDNAIEPLREAVEVLLGRMKIACVNAGVDVGSLEKLDPPPGPLCWGCDEPFDEEVVFPWATVDGHKVHHEELCKAEAAERVRSEKAKT